MEPSLRPGIDFAICFGCHSDVAMGPPVFENRSNQSWFRATSGRKKPWNQEKSELMALVSSLRQDLEKSRTEISILKRREVERDQELAIVKEQLRDVLAHPIKAILRSCGESLPPGESLTEEKMHACEEIRARWTGVLNFDNLCTDLGIANWKSVSGPTPTFTFREQLFIYLLSIRQGLSWSLLSVLIGLGRTRTTGIWRRMNEELGKWSQKHVTLPTLEQWREHHTEAFRTAFPGTYIFFADGTTLSRWHSSIPSVSRVCYNFHHKDVTRNFTILTTVDGRIVWASSLVDGKTKDHEAWNESGIASLLEDTYRGQVNAEPNPSNPNIQLEIGGDKGYPGIIIPKSWKLRITGDRRSCPKSNLATYGYDPSLMYCPSKGDFLPGAGLATFRQRVEDVIGKLKKWKLFLNPRFVANHEDQLNILIQVSSALYNFNKLPNIETTLV